MPHTRPAATAWIGTARTPAAAPPPPASTSANSGPARNGKSAGSSSRAEGPLDRDVQLDLDAARPTHRGAAEERALEQVVAVQNVVHEDLGTNQRTPRVEGVS